MLSDSSTGRCLEIEITPDMIAAGEDVLLGKLGGAVTSHWEPAELASAVFQAMAHLACGKRAAEDLRSLEVR